MGKISKLAAGAAFVGIALSSVAFSSQANAAPFYADSVTTNNVTFFNSGILTGAPDNGGAFLSNTYDPPTAAGSIVFGFSDVFTDGAGADIELFDVGQLASETYDVALSSDGISFTSIGIFSTLVNGIDINGLYAGVFSYIRVINTSQSNSPDLDAAAAYHKATVVPLPAALPLLLAGLGGLSLLRRRTNG